jgi:hypothetical protein
MTFAQFADFVNGFTGPRPIDQRLGQWAFNLLDETYPIIAEAIRGTKFDPFYLDDRMTVFLRRLLDFVDKTENIDARKGGILR